MIRVLHFVNLSVGGTGVSVMNYYRHIDRTRVQFDFLITADNRDDPERQSYFANEAKMLGANVYWRRLRPKQLIKNYRVLKRILRENPEIRVFHSHTGYAVRPAMDSLIAMLLRVPARIVYSSNDIRSQYSWRQRAVQPLLRFATTHWTAGSVAAGISMFGEKARKKLILIPRARDLNAYRYNPERRQMMRKELQVVDQYVILHVGRLVEQKNHTFLLDVFAHAQGMNPNMALLIVGEGELRHELIAKATELGLGDSVRFLGQREDIHNLMQAADLFVFPSLYEGLGGVAIEAQTAGLPCLLADTIPAAAKITELAEFLPINEGPMIWSQHIMEYRNFDRRDTVDAVRRAGYDINDAAKWLENLYLDAVGGA